MHWGVSHRGAGEWLAPNEDWLKDEQTQFVEGAARTPFCQEKGHQELTLSLHGDELPPTLVFVLYQPETEAWTQNGRTNFTIPLNWEKRQAELESTDMSWLENEIVEHEMNRNSWTLMHRFNLCHDLLCQSGADEKNLAICYVWLRYSAIRQLVWQRHYNTQPRELSHSIDRLTRLLSSHYEEGSRKGEIILLILSTLGHGNDGQRVRDEILEIMHRHHIKEVSGRFMEEWHQKLHNNTTPDDIDICEAFLEFLYSDGNVARFYEHLESKGVTRDRLKSYDRAINTDPDFVPHLKEGLIHDFQSFLRTLKAVHSGTDLNTAMNAARGDLNEDVWSELSFVENHFNNEGTYFLDLAGKIVASRRKLKDLIRSDPQADSMRNRLFLDLALESFMRVVIERNLHLTKDPCELSRAMSLCLENMQLSFPNQELAACIEHWQKVSSLVNDQSQEWALRAKGVLEQVSRLVSSHADDYYKMLQPFAQNLGLSFNAEKWTIDLFSEEVARSQPTFLVAMLNQQLYAQLREKANLGDWQLISRESAAGKVEELPTLSEVQGKKYEEPTILLVEEVGGDEDIPQGVTAVITPDSIDLMSHAAIRARNSGVLFAVCYSSELLDDLRSKAGQVMSLIPGNGSDIQVEEGCVISGKQAKSIQIDSKGFTKPRFTTWLIKQTDFSRKKVGAKSTNIQIMHSKLPADFALPQSCA
ncbi:MAG: hypothetical protein HQL32_14200, partial [Planctomycetes bacterium]|nr:hypothetical protein [Planctomycetota bacterium]